MIVEGVEYVRFQVRFTDQTGRRRRWLRWSHAVEFLRGEIAREMQDRGLESRNRIVTFARL